MSAISLPDRAVVVFDLDDTLYPERDFVRSGLRAVAALIERETGGDVYDRLVKLFDCRHPDPFGDVLADGRITIEKQRLIRTFREHRPNIVLSPQVAQLLMDLRCSGRELGIITDGRSLTQRNKIRALRLDDWINAVVISEEFGSAKPDEQAYRHIERCFPGRQYVYVGNDTSKDFVAPNHLGWTTVGLVDDGQHVHAQQLTGLPASAMPHYWIKRLA